MASRLEQLGKELMVTPLVSSAVAEKIVDRMLCAWVGRIQLKGHKHLKYSVYHLLGSRSTATAEQIKITTSFQKLEHLFTINDKEQLKDTLANMQNDRDFIVYEKVIERLGKEIDDDC